MLYIWQPFCTPIGATSKIIQLIEIVRSKDSTTVSLTTWFLSAFTNLSKSAIGLIISPWLKLIDRLIFVFVFIWLARIYTVSVESGDTMLLTNFSISFGLSAAVLLAAYYYKRNRPTLFSQQKKVIVTQKTKKSLSAKEWMRRMVRAMKGTTSQRKRNWKLILIWMNDSFVCLFILNYFSYRSSYCNSVWN